MIKAIHPLKMVILLLCLLFNHYFSSSLYRKNELANKIERFDLKHTKEVSELLTKHYSQKLDNIARIIGTCEYITTEIVPNSNGYFATFYDTPL